MIDFGGKQKLVEKIKSTIDTVVKYYLPFDELFDAIHVTIDQL
jgi:hypothetical protein